jgi:hypothetical protein
VERDKSKTIGIGWANFAAVAMETKKVRFKNKLDWQLRQSLSN